LYAHCEKLLVRSGQTVKMGEKIALMGDSGQATGSHLHFELQQNGVYLNPVYYVV
jgi:murein DD-endopeptidase MepM/ murein hydrolase activator NlpD